MVFASNRMIRQRRSRRNPLRASTLLEHRRGRQHGSTAAWAPATSALSQRAVSYYDWGCVEIHPSARKHRVSDPDTRHAATHYLIAYPLNDQATGPQRELRLGPDQAGNLLETVILLLDDGTELVIHAMRMRPKYRDLLP